MKIKILAYAIAISAVALFFQNCGKVGFHTAGASALTTVSANTPAGTNNANGNVTNTNTVNTTPPVTIGDDTNSNVTPDHSGCGNKNGSYGDDTNSYQNNSGQEGVNQSATDQDDVDNSDIDSNDHGNFEGGSEDSPDANQYVECDLGSANQLIVLANNSLTSGSNASLTRVCMSKEACLQKINAYAQARNCSLTGATTSTPTTSQCTAIFPGSVGTCHNAQILSDDAVASLLATNEVK